MIHMTYSDEKRKSDVYVSSEQYVIEREDVKVTGWRVRCDLSNNGVRYLSFRFYFDPRVKREHAEASMSYCGIQVATAETFAEAQSLIKAFRMEVLDK